MRFVRRYPHYSIIVPTPFFSHAFLWSQEDSTTVVRSVDHSKTANLEFHSTSSLKKDTDTDQVDKVGSAVTTVFESSRELVPQSYAGNATHTTEVDPALSRCSTSSYTAYTCLTFHTQWHLCDTVFSSHCDQSMASQPIYDHRSSCQIHFMRWLFYFLACMKRLLQTILLRFLLEIQIKRHTCSERSTC